MNLKTKVKDKLMVYGCVDTSVADIENGFVEVLWTAQKLTLVGFDYYLYKKSIPIGSSTTAIDLPDCTLIDHLNNTPLLHGGAHSLILIEQARQSSAAVHDVAHFHGGKQYTHADNWVIPMNFDKALMYVTIWEPTQWELDSLDHVTLTSDQPWYPDLINDTL